ncbi:MAG: hypothetical protein IJ197_11340 [Bacteroidaceae bacterium]|nr:hypothetical protein [Bacteroidaceae bacterium]
MKKMMTNKFWLMGLMLMTCLGFTSCEMDPDEGIGYDVRGHWFGDLDMWIDGERARGSEIEFMPGGWGYSYGRGIEVDYYYRGSITHYFDYRIRDGIIYMTFDDPGLDCAIVDYRLSYNYFSGYIADYYTLQNQTHFNLRNYDRYWDDYGYGGYYYYVKGEKFGTDSTATSHEAMPTVQEHKCVRGVNMKKE